MAILVAVSAINPLALNIFVPSMPGMERDFGTSFAKVQLALSLYLAAVAVAQLVLGPLSDRFGRRPVMLWGLAVFVAGSILCRFAWSIEALIVGRMIQGAGGCAGLVLSRAVVRDLYDRERGASMLGYVTMGMTIAPSIAPAIGGLLDESHGWRASFDFVLIVGVLITVATAFGMHETNFERTVAASPIHMLKAFGALLRMPMFLSFAFSGAFTSCVFFTLVGGVQYVLQTLMGLSASEAGFWFFIMPVGYAIGNYLSGRYTQRFGIIRMMTIGNVVALVACLAVAGLFGAGLFHPISVFGPMFFVGLANGLSQPSAISGAVSVRPDLAGAASGLVGTLQVGAGALATVAVGALLNDTPWPLVVLMIGFAAAAVATGAFARFHHR